MASDASHTAGKHESFGQRLPPLYIYLKRVLDKYPEGGQILKELVQNADDAKASKVVFLYDKTEHPRQRLWSDTLAEFQGPALYAYNDASFTKEDWKNIQHPEQSGKRKDPTKVGRFGLGFISVFHLTDMPCILSGDQIGYLDPLEENFTFDPNTNTRYVGERGKSWKLSPALLSEFPDQFSPFLTELFSCSEGNFQKGSFKGTIFRFPLRKRKSELSGSLFHDEDRVMELFESFQTDAELSLLFLKNIESIAAYKRCRSEEQPILIFKAQIGQEDRPQVRKNMKDFLSKVPERRNFHAISSLQIESQLGQQAELTISRFIIINALKNINTSPELNALINDKELKFLPWMGMSFRISCTLEQSMNEQKGRVFCFLPLPDSETTGLPVHVHGYFGLGDNRRSIKWPDQESQHDKKAHWNHLLVTEVLPEVYGRLILAAIDKNREQPDTMLPRDVYKGWPCIENVNSQWSDCVKKFLRSIKDEAIFYTDQGSWAKSADVYINTRNDDLISKVLVEKGCLVAQLPNHVLESLDWAGVPYKRVTPEIVRSCIRGDPLRFLSCEEKLELLEYVTSDDISDLNDLHLLPLANGKFTSFSKKMPTVFIDNTDNPSTLIPYGEGRFAARDMPNVLKDSMAEKCTQLKRLCITDVAPLLLEMLPNTWSNLSASGTLPWSPGINQQPSVEWLEIMWQWLTKNHMQVHLSAFKNMPLIPMPTNRMARLKENGLIFQQTATDPDGLSEDVCSFLETVGIVVIRHTLSDYVTRHPDLNSFIKAPTPEGVMAVLETIDRIHSTQHICLVVKDMSLNAKDELRGLLAQPHWKVLPHQQDILRQLPLFVASSGHYISAKSGIAVVPVDMFGIPVDVLKDGAKYILKRDISDNLALSLQVPVLSVRELLAENILPSVAARFYGPDDSLKIMAWVLERPEFDDLIREVQFIPLATASQQLSCPNRLFEPTKVLQVLLKNQDVFPTGAYAEGKLLKFLKRVGLKNQTDITAMDVLHAAVQLSETQATGQADVERGQVLLDHINEHPQVLYVRGTSGRTKEPLFKVLGNKCWVPCAASPPADYPVAAGWMGKSTRLYSPETVGSIESALFYGSVLPLVNLPSISEEVQRAFGWRKNPYPNIRQHVEYVVHHLKNIANTSQSAHQDSYTVSKSASVIYQFLSKASNPDVRAFFKTHMNLSQPWVWHGSGFTTPDKIALGVGNLGVSLVPYLHIVPKEMQKYSVFFSNMGVNQTFQEKELSTVLLSVQHKHQSELVPSEEDYQTDLNLISNILRYIVDQNFKTHSTKILVPCRTLRTDGERRLKMVPAVECLYVDEERLAHQLYDEDTKEEFDTPVIHESISNDLARRLGLLPLSHFLAPVDEVEFEMAGPHETTVNAIKRNLDMYKNNVDIFKELIQNADDAGATEVKFLLDWRRNEQTAYNLLSDSMKECHGPALWAYNDACFSKDDIKNICSIAAQSKKHQLDKVGRFGLGFTSVYHLTDIPSVVSGPYVLICDPRTIYLGSRVKAGQPGIKLDLTNGRHRKTLKSYPNQFQSYNGIFGCNLLASTTHYKHTLFRLPLRTVFGADSQRPNQLSDFICDSRDRIKPLIESLKKSAETLLLFTQNIVHVSLHELSGNDSVMEDVMSVTVSRLQQMPRSISHAADKVDDIRTERSLLKATTECMGDPTMPVPETTMILEITQKIHGTLENIETADINKDSVHYITSSCMSRGNISKLANTPEGLKAAVLPCGGIAAQLVAGEGGCLKLKPAKGSAFSYLPLNVWTGLPFQVNGSFLLQPNRRQLWGKSSSGTEEFEVRWNCCFIASVLCKALLNLLQDLQGLQEKGIVDARNFQSLWPKRMVCDSNFHPLVDAFYQRIGMENNAPAVICDEGRWLTVHDCFFTAWETCDPESLRCSIKALLAKNQDPKKWVELEPDVISSISAAGENRWFDDNTFSVKRFLREIFFPAFEDSQHIESDHHKEIILHVLDLRLGGRKVTTYDEELRTTKCVPASPSGNELKRPDQLVNPRTSIGSLYSEDNCRFPHGSEFRKQARLLSLSQLGMATDDLSWEDICERAESMLKDGQCERRSAILLKLISKKLTKADQPTSEQKRRIQQANFLPVLKIPDGYPAKWYTCEDEFMSAARLYASCHKDLLGSVQPLLDENRLALETIGPQTMDFLGIHKKEVAVTDVVQQLTEVIKEASGVMPQTLSMSSSIFSFLQKEVCESHFLPIHGSVKEKHRAAFDKLCTMRFVLCEGAFRECKQLAFEYSGPSGPYLFRVPPELIPFKNLLKLCGIRDKFEVNDFLQTLQKLKTKYEDTPLPKSDLKTAKAMMSEIVSKSAADSDGTRNILEGAKIYIPDNRGVLRTTSELTFNDVDWEGSWGNNVYTHSGMSFNDAKVFGIITQREKQLETCSSSSGFEMEFGQQEELTDRLSGILRSYPNVSDVFKEVLQNADDAGATEIHFVHDPRSHPSKKIISKSWAAVQQLPSLCIYNDKPFTEADIKGIQKVGVGGKRDDIATTGKFGIGFNAVYHLTDCPSFMSNSDTLCVFDPLLKYVQGTRKTSPGKRFSTAEKFRELYPDMLSGYLEDIDEICGKKGTMFRLPLRAQASVISRNVYSSSDMCSLLDDFQKVSQDALLFLNNITKITISRIEEQTGKIRQLFSINATLADEDRRSRLKLVEHLTLFNEHPWQEIAPMSCVYSLETKDSNDNLKSWLISQMLGFKGLDVDSQVLSNAADLKKPLPRGGVAALMKDSRQEDTCDQQCTAYCFLPLPIYTALPVHVNGTFELDAARKSLKKGCAYEDGLIHQWNKLLVENVIAPAYAELITHARRTMLGETSHKDQLKQYDDIFPKHLEVVHGEWRLLAEATLRYISDNNLEVLPVVKPTSGNISWHHPNSDLSLAFFDDFDENVDSSVDVTTSKLQSSAALLRPFLLKVGFHLLASSPKLCLAFQACDVKAEFVSAQAVVHHLSSESVITPELPAPLTKTAFKDLKTFKAVFEYCLDGLTKPTDLHGLPLKLANDETLGQFTEEDGLYMTLHWRVLPSLGDLFLHKDLVKLCTAWFDDNELSEDAFTSSVFKKFTIAELGRYLGEQLPEDWRGCDQHVEWQPKKEGQPLESWLRDLWKFICSETSEENSQFSLQAIENWPIFPTTAGNLVPPTKSKTVLALHSLGGIGFGLKVAEVLRKLGLPEIAWKKMCVSTCNTADPPTDLTPILHAYLALPKSYGDVIGVIQYMTATSAPFGKLEPKECGTLLHYFQEGCDDETLTLQNIQVIKSLPIFMLLGETKTTDVQRPLNYHTVEGYDVLREEANIWMDNMKCVFLEANPTLSLIHKELGISPITHAEVYLKYILPSFHLLTQKARIKHIENIRDEVVLKATREDGEVLLNRLTNVEFIYDQLNTLRPASYFYDPRNPVFKAMVDQGMLLPEQPELMRPPMREFLARIGLHTDVTPENFIKFARKIEDRGNLPTDKNQLKVLCDNSKLLKNELDYNDSLHDQRTLLIVATIKFIPSTPIKPELLEICPAYPSSDIQTPARVPFIAYCGSVPSRYTELVWSASSVLPYWALQVAANKNIGKKKKRLTVHECLGIVTDESAVMEKVLAHTKLVCGSMEKKNVIHKEDKLPKKVREEVKGVMNKILQYLKDSVTKHRENIKRCLLNTPICPVENSTVFVKADQLVFNFGDMKEGVLKPYLYTIPRELMCFESIFKLLGAQEKCSFDQLAGVLAALENDCENEQMKLNPNQQKSAKCAVGGIFKLLHDQKEKCQISASKLYLPTVEYSLMEAPQLYYADPDQMQQLDTVSSGGRAFILPLRECGFRCKNEIALFSYLPSRLRPKFLKDELQEKPCDTNEDCREGHDCQYLAHIKHMVTSDEMTEVLLRLCQHQLNELEVRVEDVKRIEVLQDFNQLSCKVNLELGFYDNDGRKVANQQFSRKAFLDKNTSTLFLEHVWPLDKHMSQTFREVAECCNDLLGGLLNERHVSILQSALDSPSPFEMSDVLSSNKIPYYYGDSWRHRPGTIIPRDVRTLLNDDPFNRFEAGEIVGYRRTIGELPPEDAVATRSRERRAISHALSTDEATEIIYAVIVGQVGTDEENSILSRQYEIDVGLEEHLIVSVTTLFKFLSLKDEDDRGLPSRPNTLPADPQNDIEQIQREVREAMALPKEEQKRVINRLYRKWHPDKNPGQEERTNKAFQFLIQEINRCDVTDQYEQHYSCWESEVRRDREEARRYQQMHNRSRRRRRNNARCSNVPPSFSRESPDPRSARLWFRQAREHLSAAEKTSQLGPSQVQWIAFQVHQAAEVALKAAQYSLTGRPDTHSNSVTGLASIVCNHRYVTSNELKNIASDLERHECLYDKPRYPVSRISQTSGQAYQGFSVEDAMRLSKALLSLVQDIIGINEF
ncbi:sacsin-like [Patiria miniata]|uniref:Sacsin n=1 Tax=Patiria miniata TaxID=46514 RepID=A0A913ZZD6_PATMI|nr:sacsin-like [Patiria miniata]